jgi:hypothetical protein
MAIFHYSILAKQLSKKLPDNRFYSMCNSKILAIISHDAGGAEILANYVSQNKIACRFVLEGPAVSVFERQLGTVEIISLAASLSVCDEVLCGTSWQSDLEWLAIEQAQRAGKHVVAFLDHWINYPERFIRNGVQHLPDELWVGDEDAERLAREHFPNTLIRLEPNPYFIEIQRQVAELGVRRNPSVGNGKIVLFVSENISDHARLRYGDERYWGYTEFDAIEYFLENINVFEEKIEKVVIRSHPSDPAGKYDSLANKYFGIVQLSDGKPLLNEIIESDIVVGSQSAAMVVGLLAHKKVVSCIPPRGIRCALPQKQIIHYSEMLSKWAAD